MIEKRVALHRRGRVIRREQWLGRLGAARRWLGRGWAIQFAGDEGRKGTGTDPLLLGAKRPAGSRIDAARGAHLKRDGTRSNHTRPSHRHGMEDHRVGDGVGICRRERTRYCRDIAVNDVCSGAKDVAQSQRENPSQFGAHGCIPRAPAAAILPPAARWPRAPSPHPIAHGEQLARAASCATVKVTGAAP